MCQSSLSILFQKFQKTLISIATNNQFTQFLMKGKFFPVLTKRSQPTVDDRYE